MSTQKKKFGFLKTILLALLALVLGVGIAVSGKLVETNASGHYQVKQAWVTGTMTIRNAEGTYWQGMGRIEDYDFADEIYLSSDVLDGGDGAEVGAVKILFPNGSADVDAVTMYELSLAKEDQMNLHRRYNSHKGVKSMVRQQVLEALKNTATLMSAEEAYSSRKAEYISLTKAQLLRGLYASQVDIDTVETNGQTRYVKHYSVKVDDNGQPVIMKESVLSKYNITISQFNVKDMAFDPITTALIMSRKEAEKAQQDAITAKAKGDIKIASTKATEESEKIRLVTIAEKEKAVAVLNAQREFEVSQLKAKQALEAKKATVLEAEATKAMLQIADGLSDREKYQIDANKEATIQSAKYFSQWVGPKVVISGGGDSKGGSQLENSLMLKNYMDIASTMKDSKKK